MSSKRTPSRVDSKSVTISAGGRATGSGSGAAGVSVTLQRDGLSHEEMEELKEAFDLFDADGGGSIDASELKKAMESLGFDKKNKLALGLLDSLKDGEIKFPEFVDMMTARVSDSENKVLTHTVPFLQQQRSSSEAAAKQQPTAPRLTD